MVYHRDTLPPNEERYANIEDACIADEVRPPDPLVDRDSGICMPAYGSPQQQSPITGTGKHIPAYTIR